MTAMVRGIRADTETRPVASRLVRPAITASNVHVLEVPRAHIGLTGQTLETIGLPEPEILDKDALTEFAAIKAPLLKEEATR